MSNKIQTIVFGVKDQTLMGGCGCTAGSSDETIWDMYKQLEDFVQRSDIKEDVDLKFVDLLEDDMTDYAYIQELLKQGIAPPFLAFDGEVKFYGGFTNSIYYQEVKRRAKL